MSITQQQYTELKRQGYDDESIVEAQQQQDELQDSYNRTLIQQRNDPRAGASNTIIAGMNPSDALQWQLELDSILERVEHLLRGDKPTFKDGSIVYVSPINAEDCILNEHGVGEVMRELSLYINRNTILSNYDVETINWKVLDFGKRLSDLFFTQYDKWGMNTPEKRALYDTLVMQITDTVHSSYLRALHGLERDSIRKTMSINQNQSSMMDQMGQPIQEKRGFISKLNPFNWGR